MLAAAEMGSHRREGRVGLLRIPKRRRARLVVPIAVLPKRLL